MGGGSFNVSKSISESDPFDMTPWEYTNLRSTVAGGLSDIISSGGGPKWKGPFVAPITQAELDQLGYLNELQAPTRETVASDELLAETVAGKYLTPDSNPFLADYVRAAQSRVGEAYDTEEMERRALFARAGHRLPESSPFAYAQAKAQGEYAQATSDIATNVYANAYAAERNIQMEAVEAQRVEIAQTWQVAMQNLEAQALPRMIEQMGIDNALEEFYRRQQLLAAALGIAGQVTDVSIGVGSDTYSFGWGMSGGGSGGGGGGTEG